jgi:two-component system LytT family response regulator
MKSTLNTIIVDDETLARRGLAIRLDAFAQITVVANCTNGREAISEIYKLKPDLVFLDIQMPGLNGFRVVQELKDMQTMMPQVIFVTAFDQYAIKAFEINAIDYLLKPVDHERLGLAIAKVERAIEQSNDSEHKAKLVQLVSDVTGNNTQQILEELANNAPVTVSSYSNVLAIKDIG